MRPIKFKIWNKKKNEWHHKEPISLFGEVIIMGEILNANLEDNPISLEELNNLVPLQFTGLLDKNGKEIYEGDIIKGTMYKSIGGIETIYVVTWNEEIGYWGTDKDTSALGSILKNYDFEVIGNCFENPDLLTNER